MALKSLSLLDQYKTNGFPSRYPKGIKTFYAPVDNVHQVLLDLINSASSSLYLAMFAVEDTSLADAVKVKCQDPKITVQLTFDYSQAQVTYEKTLLTKENYPATSVAIGNSEHNAYMHLKTIVIDGLDVATGSTNWTASGQKYQDNNLIIIRNKVAAQEAVDRLTAVHQFILNKGH